MNVDLILPVYNPDLNYTGCPYPCVSGKSGKRLCFTKGGRYVFF